MDKQKVIIILLLSAVVILVNSIFIEKWMENIQEDRISFYEDGYEQGLVDAVNAIFHNTDNCSITTITLENETRSIIDTSCLNPSQNNSLP